MSVIYETSCATGDGDTLTVESWGNDGITLGIGPEGPTRQMVGLSYEQALELWTVLDKYLDGDGDGWG